MTLAPELKQTLSRYGAWIVLGLAILLVLIVRVRLRDMPLERDEGEYAYAGQLILQGVPPYKVAYNMKLPGTYCAYAVIMASFGQSPAGIHLGLMLVNLASIILVFLIGRKVLDDVTGAVAAVVFALLSLSPSVLGLAAHATHFVAFFALAGTWLLIRSVSTLSPPPSLLFLSGFLFGLAFLMKQHGFFFGLFGGLYLAWTLFSDRIASRSNRRKEAHSRNPPPQSQRLGPVRLGLSALQFLCFATGCLLPYMLTCLVLWLSGVFPQFIFWTLSYASKYVAASPLFNRPDLLLTAWNAAAGPNFVFWIIPWIGAILIWWEERFDEARRQKTRDRRGFSLSTAGGEGVGGGGIRTGGASSLIPSPDSLEKKVPFPRLFLTLFLLASFASTCVGFYFRSHYFITLLPALALLTGVAVSRSLRLLKSDRSIELFLAAPIAGLFPIGLLVAIIGNASLWFGMSPADAVREIYNTTLFAEARKIGDFIKRNTSKNSRIAVLGSEPEIYFYSYRRSVTGYIYTYPLMEPQPYALRMQEEMINEIERGQPEYVVFVKDEKSWLRRSESEHKLDDWWENYWTSHLDLVQTIDLQGRNESPGTDKETEPLPERKSLLVLKQKELRNAPNH